GLGRSEIEPQQALNELLKREQQRERRKRQDPIIWLHGRRAQRDDADAADHHRRREACRCGEAHPAATKRYRGTPGTVPVTTGGSCVGATSMPCSPARSIA